MTNEECLGRLTASATHDLCNALAVMRESAGLAEDMLRMGKDAAEHNPRLPRLLDALSQVQQQIHKGAALADGMGYLAACVSGGEDVPRHCDLNRVVHFFCTMMARRARGCAVELQACPDSEPVLVPRSEVTALELFRDLLVVFDICVAVGGGMSLRLTPLASLGKGCGAGIACDIPAQGTNVDMALSALTACPLLRPLRKSLWERLLPRGDVRRFVLPAGAGAGAGAENPL